LIVDDDEAIRRLVRLNLTDLYEIFDTGQPEEALALALEHKPDAILLDLPGYSGFELCKIFTSFSATQLIPVFVISGEGGAKTKDFCCDLGAAGYFEKPVDFNALRDSLAQVHSLRMERRKEVRVGPRVPLKLSGGTRVVRILACQAWRKMSAKGFPLRLRGGFGDRFHRRCFYNWP
jgi:DNA-binding response OmpR family regulator